MTDPVTNALAVQMEYGDEELQKDIEQRIRKIATEVVLNMTHSPEFFDRMIVNNAFMFNKAVARAMRDHMDSTARY